MDNALPKDIPAWPNIVFVKEYQTHWKAFFKNDPKSIQVGIFGVSYLCDSETSFHFPVHFL
jgi:hypothetical protein